MGPDEKEFSIYRSQAQRHSRRAALKYRVPVFALGAKPESRNSKFRVAVLPLPHRRRKPLAEGQPHRIESRLESLLQLSILVLPLVLLVVGTAYFIYHFDSSTQTRQESAPFIHDPKLLHTNGVADDLTGFGWRR